MTTESLDIECSDPQELYGMGVRAFILQDHEAAVEALSKATELLVHQHKDDLHESLGKVYLFYGKALLGSARANIEPLGEAVPKSAFDDSEDSDEDDEEDEGIEAEASDLPPVNGDSAEASEKPGAADASEKPGPADASDEPGPAKANEQPGPAEPKNVNGDSAEASVEPGPSTSKPEDPIEQEDGSDDLELAWEVLELAKKIFEKQEDKKQTAETLIVLGEVSLESGNFESAINDIKQGLELQKELFPKDSRTVAETLYKLGMAYTTNSQMEEAIVHFQAALDYLNNRIKTLEETKVQNDNLREEIDEIRELMPEIEEKITETRIYKDEAKKTLTEALNGVAKKTEGSPTVGTSSTSPKPVTNISHLVKRKRKMEEEPTETEESAPKKPATDIK